MATRIPKLSNQILEEASSWFIDFREGEPDAADREKFNAWLRRSPEHVRAYLEISAMWEDAEALRTPEKQKIDLLVAHARAEQNVVPLDLDLQPERAMGSQSTTTQDPTRRRYLALAAGVVMAFGAGVGTWLYEQRDVYVTALGEQRSITLEDGSSVQLNSRSRLKVRFSQAERHIELLEGQALFRVAKNPTRPFIVRSDDTSVRAVGTQFDVYRKRGGTLVTVLEGQVAVIAEAVPAVARAAVEEGGTAQGFDAKKAPRSPGAQSAPERASADARRDHLLLSAGEQVRITPTAVDPPKPANLAIALAWTQQKLAFEETPLREVVEEFNRYNRQQLVIADPELYDFHVSGVFASTDSGRMLEFLRQRFGVTMNDSGDEIVISRR